MPPLRGDPLLMPLAVPVLLLLVGLPALAAGIVWLRLCSKEKRRDAYLVAASDELRAAGAVMGAAVWGSWRLLGGGTGDTIARKLVLVFVPIATGIAVYLVLARLLGMSEMRRFFRRRHGDRQVPGPDSKDVSPPG